MNKIMNEFIQIINAANLKLSEIHNEIASDKKLQNKWSRKEILGHLIDSAHVNYNRFIRAFSKNDLIFESYPQDRWVEIQQYNNRDWNELIDLWRSINLHILELIKNIHEEKKFHLTRDHNFDKICW